MQMVKRCLLLTVVLSVSGMQLILYGQQPERNHSHKAEAHFSKKDTVPEQLPVLYRTQPEITKVQAAAVTSGPAMEQMPVFDINNTLYGKLAGLYVRQSSGDPGDDGASLSLRGLSPTVLVDGIPRSITSINPEQIESVTVLKDALSTAMLGMRGNNGAVLITTRKGYNMQNQLNFTVNRGWQTPLKFPKPLRAYDYATLYNEALANDGKPAVYSAADLQAYKDGSDPYGHPDVDWRKTLLTNQSSFTRYNLNIGGSAPIYRYFLSLDYLNQQGIYQQSDLNKYSTNSGYKRYNLRGNVEVDINKYLTTSLNIFGRIQDENEPGVGATELFNNFLRTPANAYPIFNPDQSLGGNQSFQNNLYGQLIYSGYRQGFARDGGADLAIKRKLDDLLKGLWVKGVASFYGTLSQSTDRSRTLEVFKMNVGAANDITYQRFGTRKDQVNSSVTDSWNQQFYSEVSMGYTASANQHNLETILLANTQTYRNGPRDLPQIFKGINGYIAYNYAKKYMLELGGNYSGNNRFPVGKQAGFFPSIGAGWNIAHEDFFKNPVTAIDVFKLRGSYGKTGNAAPGYYLFEQYYAGASGYTVGATGTGVSGITESTLANPFITWEKALKINAGLDVSFWKNKVYASVDYFNNKLYDLLRTRGNNSSLIGNNYPQENIGIFRYSGWEFDGGVSQKLGKVLFNASLNVTAIKTRAEYIDEPKMPYDWMMRTGNKLGQFYGFISEGFFKDQNDINTSAKPEGYTPVPGDLKYKDLNGDGIINNYDETGLSNLKPEIYLGSTIAAHYKGLELNVLLNAVKNRDLMLSGTGHYEFTRFENGIGQAYEHHLNRWTPATAATATYPRLTINGNPNNQRSSSFWLRSGSYFRIRNVELAYNFSNSFFERLKIDRFRVFANAFNLFTFSKLETIDPEVTGGYPNTRTISVGASIRFK